MNAFADGRTHRQIHTRTARQPENIMRLALIGGGDLKTEQRQVQEEPQKRNCNSKDKW